MIGFGRKFGIQTMRSGIRASLSNPRMFAFTRDNFLSGENAVYAEEMYDLWKKDPSSVHSSWSVYFSNIEKGIDPRSAYVEPPFDGLPPVSHRVSETPASLSRQASTTQVSKEEFETQLKVYRMIDLYRRRGHLLADLDPVNLPGHGLLYEDRFYRLTENPEHFGFTSSQINQKVKLPVSDKIFAGKSELTPLEIAQKLEEIYCNQIGFEYAHIPEQAITEWIQEKIESEKPEKKTREEREELLDRILKSQGLTEMLHLKYGSSKRYGAEGCEAGISGLEHLADISKDYGVEKLILGMPHRGRFNIMAGMFKRTHESIFDAFNDRGAESEIGFQKEWNYSGDVKYHIPVYTTRSYPDGKKIRMVRIRITLELAA